MSKLKERSLISFGNDITRTRDEILMNLEVLGTKEGRKAFLEKVDNIPKNGKGYVAAIPSIGLMNLAFMSPFVLKDEEDDSESNEFKLYADFKSALENKPLDIHSNILFFVELMYYIDNPTFEQVHIIDRLRHEMHKNEFIIKEVKDYQRSFNVEESIDQSNKIFPLYFAYAIRQMPILRMNDFLTHQLALYKGDFKIFLEDILLNHEDEKLFLPKTVKAVEKWLAKNEFSKELATKSGKYLSEDEVVKVLVNFLSWTKKVDGSKGKILFDKDYNRLLTYAKKLVVENKLPDTDAVITGVTYVGFMKRIRYSFYLIHCEIQGNKPVNGLYIDFLHQVFPDKFKGKKSTTKTKFSTPTDFL